MESVALAELLSRLDLPTSASAESDASRQIVREKLD